MLRTPHTHTFTIEGDTFTLTEYQTRGSEARIQATYAESINSAPLAKEMYDGGNLWVEAVAKECLSQAPAWCWRDRMQGEVPSRFDPLRLITLEAFPRRTWPLFRKEVNAFLADLPQPLQPDDVPDPASLSRESDAVAAPQVVPVILPRRAE